MKFILCVFILFSGTVAFAKFDFECTSLEAQSPSQIEKIYITIGAKKNSELILSGFGKKETLNDVECSLRHTPEDTWICEHDRLILVISANEVPAMAVLNTFEVNNKGMGPYYFTCE